MSVEIPEGYVTGLDRDAEVTALRAEVAALKAERDNLNQSFCNVVTRCEAAEAALAERTRERDNSSKCAKEMAQAVTDLTAERDAAREALPAFSRLSEIISERDALRAEVAALKEERDGLRLALAPWLALSETQEKRDG